MATPPPDTDTRTALTAARDHLRRVARTAAADGIPDQEIADLIGVTPPTLQRWARDRLPQPDPATLDHDGLHAELGRLGKARAATLGVARAITTDIVAAIDVAAAAGWSEPKMAAAVGVGRASIRGWRGRSPWNATKKTTTE